MRKYIRGKTTGSCVYSALRQIFQERLRLSRISDLPHPHLERPDSIKQDAVQERIVPCQYTSAVPVSASVDVEPVPDVLSIRLDKSILRRIFESDLRIDVLRQAAKRSLKPRFDGDVLVLCRLTRHCCETIGHVLTYDVGGSDREAEFAGFRRVLKGPVRVSRQVMEVNSWHSAIAHGERECIGATCVKILSKEFIGHFIVHRSVYDSLRHWRGWLREYPLCISVSEGHNCESGALIT